MCESILDLNDDCYSLILLALKGDSDGPLDLSTIAALSSVSPEVMLKTLRVIGYVDSAFVVNGDLTIAQLQWLCSRRAVDLSYTPPQLRLELRGLKASDLNRLVPVLPKISVIRATNKDVWGMGTGPLLAQATHLHSLDFSRASKITDSSLMQLQCVRSLENLDLTGCVRLTDEGLAVFSMDLRIRYLDLTGCTGLSGAALAKLAPLKESLGTSRSLALALCLSS